MENKIKELIEKYEKIIEDEQKFSIMYEEIGNEEMMYNCMDKKRHYENVVKDLKEILNEYNFKKNNK